jgi:hypothetical protein
MITAIPKRPRAQRNLERPLDTLTVPQQAVLEALARYRYLSVAQMVAAGVARNESHIRADVLPRLCQRVSGNLVEAHDFPQFSAKGRLPKIYTLTQRGAEIVADIRQCEAGNILWPIGGVQYANDFPHRAAYLDACIAFDRWIAADDARHCRALCHYFDKTGANRSGVNRMRSVNRIDLPDGSHIIPDGLAFFDNGERLRAVAIELHRATSTGDVVAKLADYFIALETDAVSRYFGHDKAARVLSIATEPALILRVMNRLVALPGFVGSRAFELMAFNSLDTVKADFGQGWVRADQKPVEIFT